MSYVNPTDEARGALLHGLPRLEKTCDEKEDRKFIDHFALVFPRSFEGGPVRPRLQHLELPWVTLTQDSSAGGSERVLTERDACGGRLKWIGSSDDTTEKGDMLVLEPFRDLVAEIQWRLRREAYEPHWQLNKATGPGVPGFPFEHQTRSVDTSSQLVSLSNPRMLIRFVNFMSTFAVRTHHLHIIHAFLRGK